MREATDAEAGFALIAAVVVLLSLLILIFALCTLMIPALKTGYSFFDSVEARYQAEAGVAQMIAKIRGNAPTLPAHNGSVLELALDLEEGFSYGSSVNVTNTGHQRYVAEVLGFGGITARRRTRVDFISLASPQNTDGAICAYASVPPPIVVGSSFVSGGDYRLPSTFSCKDTGCVPTELTSLTSVPTTYNATSGGVVNSQSDLLTLMNYIATNNIQVFSSRVGTREEPIITVVPAERALTLGEDGAGLLIVGNNSSVVFAAGVHYEGIVILAGTGSIAGGHSNYVYGAVLFVGPPSGVSIVFNGTKPNVVYSSSALSNLQKLNSFLTRIVSVQPFTAVN